MIKKLQEFRSSKVFSDLGKFGDYTIKMFNLLLMGMVLLIGYRACNVEGEIDGAIFDYNRKTGHWEIGHIKTKKIVKEPKTKKDNNMVSIGIDNNGIRTYDFRRRLWTPLGMGIWGGVFVREGLDPRLGNQFAGGLSLSITF